MTTTTITTAAGTIKRTRTSFLQVQVSGLLSFISLLRFLLVLVFTGGVVLMEWSLLDGFRFQCFA